jgi:hypothetical protein
VAVPLEQGLAVGEERSNREAIVLQDDGLLDRFEDPVEAGRHPPPAAHVLGGVVLEHPAVPVHPLDDGAGLCALLRLARAAGTGPVGDHQECRRLRPRDGGENLLRHVGAVEDQEGDGRFQFVWHRLARSRGLT